MTIKVEIKDNRIFVNSPYNAAFIGKAKEIGGRWDAPSKSWTFEESNKNLVNDALIDFYGEGINGKAETIKVDYQASKFEDVYKGNISIGNLVTVTRRYRDRPVTITPGTIVIEGSFETSGGSSKSPRPDADTDVILRTELPLTVYNSLSDKVKEKLTVQSDRADLEAEKARLLARLAEIDALLK